MTHPLRRLRAGVLLLATAAAIGALVTFVGEPSWDEALVADARALRDGWSGALLRVMSEYGYSLWLGPASLVAALVLGVALQRWRDALLVGFATVLAALLTRLLKQTFERARPADGVDLLASGFSMPSGHATASAAFAASLLLVTHRGFLRRLLAVVAPTLAALVGISRVAFGVHYPSDVLAGFCVGVGTTLLLAGLLGRVTPADGARVVRVD